MIIWANANDINIAMAKEMRELYSEWTKESLVDFKPWELSIILRQIQIHFGERKDISLLDFGVGTCPFGAYLNHIGYQFVTCLDKIHCWKRARKMNTEIYNKEYNAHVKYIKTDITSDYDGLHDVIFSASVLEHIEDKERIEVMRALARHLTPNGLLIHAVDYVIPEEGKTTDIKELIANCGIPVSFKPKETPGCKEFKNPPEHTWWYKNKISRVAFFNEMKGGSNANRMV